MTGLYGRASVCMHVLGCKDSGIYRQCLKFVHKSVGFVEEKTWDMDC